MNHELLHLIAPLAMHYVVNIVIRARFILLGRVSTVEFLNIKGDRHDFLFSLLQLLLFGRDSSVRLCRSTGRISSDSLEYSQVKS
jgi:hypothetical protein